MYRAILTPKESRLTIELPEDMVGKPVEILAFDLNEVDKTGVQKKPTAEEIRQFYLDYQVDMSGFRFNREEANER